MKRGSQEDFQPLTQADVKELEACIAFDRRILRGISISLLIPVGLALCLEVLMPPGPGKKSLVWLVGGTLVAAVPLAWIAMPYYKIMVQTKRDLRLGYKRVFASTVERKVRDKKEQWVNLITSNQEALTIPVAEDEQYSVGDVVYVEQAPASKLPLKMERVKPGT
ncbi:MAG TPA: hypothetical protein VF646_15325 [Cytophagales bacterium]